MRKEQTLANGYLPQPDSDTYEWEQLSMTMWDENELPLDEILNNAGIISHGIKLG